MPMPLRRGKWSISHVTYVILNTHIIFVGYLATDANVYRQTGDPADLKSLTDRIPAGRQGDPEDSKGPTDFFAGEASSYMNGFICLVSASICGLLLTITGRRYISQTIIHYLVFSLYTLLLVRDDNAPCS